ncbi:COR domain-containing protein [Mucilaginibacter sp. R-33]|uniref:COR domain-containing protein n=1 Tax=Mucilaginibacter sp. R-33 TaxID=3416711 RepID=UPI003CF04CEE
MNSSNNQSSYLNKINQVLLNQGETIDLSTQNLIEVPDELLKIRFIKRLNLSGNPLEKLPDWLCEFENLELLDLKDCRLKTLFPEISKLKNLRVLYLSRNDLTELPVGISDLDNLNLLFAKSNKITHLPNWAFNIQTVDYDGNPVVDPPLEIYNRGSEAILNYIREKAKGTKKIYEAKLLIVGEPGAGKTSLMRKLINEKYQLNPSETSTLGIEIQPYFFKSGNNNFRINIWDFGGQEIYHSTHQFFLTKRSLYILLADNRAEDTDFNYWLQTVELLSENSPLLITLNEKQNRKKDINILGMRERFSTLHRAFSFNLATDVQNLKKLKEHIELEVRGLSHMGDELPKSWVEIREKLEKKSKNKPFISDTEYFEICKSIGGYDIKQAQLLSEYFHDIGIFLHFQDNPVLKRWVILKPDWGTQAVYKILDDDIVINSNGFFTKHDIQRLWNNEFYKSMHDELLALMTKFELCYSIEEKKSSYIVPELLQRNRPLYKWDKEKNLTIKYEYEFMPKGIITRFIVRVQEYIENQELVWREGVILKRGDNARAEITQTYGKKEFLIKIYGYEKKEFLTIILYHIDKINNSFKNIKVKKLVPCICSECFENPKPYYYEYEYLKRLQSKNINIDRCNNSLEEIKVNALLDNTFGKDSGNSKSKTRVYISYSTEDNLIKQRFYKHFLPLIKEYGLIVWDQSKITAGNNEKRERNENLSTADIFICLITPNYHTNEVISVDEIEKIIEKAVSGNSLIIPIMMQNTYNDSSPFADYMPISYNRQPIYNNKNIDEALVDVIYQIKDSIIQFNKKRKEMMENN